MFFTLFSIFLCTQVFVNTKEMKIERGRKKSFFQFNKLENKKNARDAENEEITPLLCILEV